MAGEHKRKKSGGIPLWSWIAASIGAILVLSFAGFLIAHGSAAKDASPDLTAEMVEVTSGSHGYLVNVRVSNRGKMAASAVVIEGCIKEGREAIETSTVTVDYVPAGSHRGVGLIFRSDPRKSVLEIQPRSYVEP